MRPIFRKTEQKQKESMNIFRQKYSIKCMLITTKLTGWIKMSRSMSIQSPMFFWEEVHTVLSGWRRVSKVFSYICCKIGNQDLVVREDQEKVFHKAKAIGWDGQCWDQPFAEAQTSQYNPFQRCYIFSRKGKDVHRPVVLCQGFPS